MRYMEVDGKPASVLGFGCGGVLGRVGRRDSLEAIRTAWDAGITLFDTARSYGYGEAEGLLGEFLRGRRERAVVVTKFGIWPEPIPGWKRRARPVVRAGLRLFPGARSTVRRAGVSGTSSAGRFDVQTLRRSLEESLRQLRTEYVDMLLMHEATPKAVADEELIAELEAVVREGKARRLGVSATGPVVAELEGSWPDWVRAVQLPANLFEARQEFGRSRDLFTMGNHPFGGTEEVQTAIEVLHEIAGDRWADKGLRQKLAAEPREALARVVFATAFASGVDAVVPSMLHESTVRANVAAVDGASLSAAELHYVRERIGKALAAAHATLRQ